MANAVAESGHRKTPRRRWFQYSLRTFFVGVTALTIFIAWWSRSALRQKEAIEAVKAAGGSVEYDFGYKKWPAPESPLPAWLVTFFGVDFFHNVVEVRDHSRQPDVERPPTRDVLIHLQAFPRLKSLSLVRWAPSNDDVRQIARFRHLEDLRLLGSSTITDDGIRCLSRLDRLTAFYLDTPHEITEKGVAALEQLPRLKKLVLVGTDLTPAAWARVGKMKQLTQLGVIWSANFSDPELQNLADLTNLSDLILAKTNVTDEGLTALAGMTELTTVRLDDTQITDDGLRHLAPLKKLFGLAMTGTCIGDKSVEQLSSMTSLITLRLEDTAITSAGLQKLQAALPGCAVSTRLPPTTKATPAER